MKHLVRRISTLALLALCGATCIASAEIRLPGMLSDHAVLQRNAPIHIWGWADPDEKLTVHFHDQTVSTAATKFGEWSLWLMPEQAGGPYVLTVDGSSKITVSDLLVGDVWFASGQSNMEIPLKGFPSSAVIKNAKEEIAHANLSQVRLLHFGQKSSDVPLNDVTANWTECTPDTATSFSAVAYFFGREIQQREHVPVGLIDATWGGTPIDSWISLNTLGSDPSLMPVFVNRAQFTKNQSRLNQIIASEKAEDAAALSAHQPLPKHHWHPEEDSWLPAGLYNGMIAPATAYTIKGVIWYQGETDSAPERASLYQRLFPALIADWRTQWNQGNFPFLFVQISSFDSPEESWGEIRNAQRRTLSVAGTAMAVSLDVGLVNNVHPPDKQTVSARLALAARATVYGENVEFSGPLYRQTTTDGSALRVWFDHAEGLKSNGPKVESFEIAGEDHHFVPATAKIEGETVVVSNPTVSSPRYIRYGWDNFTSANLYNQDDLPAPTFTSELSN
jgi:sialate O-acetylesterase